MNIMSETKPLASLSSGLLARKGAAKPAMRRQGIAGLTPPTEAELDSMHDDLGWNDMGYDVDPDPNRGQGQEKPANPLMGAVPEVVRQRDDLAERLKASDSLANGEARDGEAGSVHSPFDNVAGEDEEALEQQSSSEEEQDETPTRDDHVHALQNDVSAYDYGEDDDEDEIGLGSFADRQDDSGNTGAPINIPNSPLSVKKSAGTQPKWTEPDSEDEEEYDEEDAFETRAPQPAEQAKLPQAKKPVHIPAPQKKPASQPAASAGKAGKRAAFTLRLDSERHLKLRLACAMQNMSAQQFVTQALDEYLAGIPEVNEMAGRVPNNRGK